MAAWQFDLSLVPRAALGTHSAFEAEPVPRSEFESTHWWASTDLPSGYQHELGSLLGAEAAWGDEWEVYGHEDGNRIDVLRRGTAIEEVRLRLDVRILDINLLEALLDFVQRCGCVMVSPDLHVIEPRLDSLCVELELSSASQFVRDPQAFLEQIRKRRDPA